MGVEESSECLFHLSPFLLQSANVSNRHADEARGDAGELLLLRRHLTAGAAAGAGHEGLVIAQAHGHEPKLNIVLQLTHQEVSPIHGFHVDAEKPAVAVVHVGH